MSSVCMNREDGWVEVIHRGSLTLKVLEEARRQAVEVLLENGVSRILVDVRDSDLTLLSIADTYTFQATHDKAFSDVSQLRIAAIVAPRQLEHGVFAETVARNRGIDLRIFVGADEARAWLAIDPEQQSLSDE